MGCNLQRLFLWMKKRLRWKMIFVFVFFSYDIYFLFFFWLIDGGFSCLLLFAREKKKKEEENLPQVNLKSVKSNEREKKTVCTHVKGINHLFISSLQRTWHISKLLIIKNTILQEINFMYMLYGFISLFIINDIWQTYLTMIKW